MHTPSRPRSPPKHQRKLRSEPLTKDSIPGSLIERRIYRVHGQKVMLDADLAELYDVPTSRLSEQVRRNLKRFPKDFMFQLTQDETKSLISQIAISRTGRGRITSHAGPVPVANNRFLLGKKATDYADYTDRKKSLVCCPKNQPPLLLIRPCNPWLDPSLQSNITGHLTGHYAILYFMEKGELTVTATEFKAKCLSILEHLDSRGIIVTKRGRPVARVLPVGQPRNEELIGSMKGQIRIHADVFTTGVAWRAESRHPHTDSNPGRKPRRR